MERTARTTESRGIPLLLAALAAVAAFVAFLPALDCGFVWDDEFNFVRNHDYRGLSPAHLGWAFTFTRGHYIPLTWVTFGLDYHLWGMEPRGYHLSNLILHSLNTLLVYLTILWLLRRSARPDTSPAPGRWLLPVGAFFGALFFALHPQRVESVAWITERRDLLATFFGLLTVLGYLRATSKDNSDVRPSHRLHRGWYLASLAAFLAALLSKAIAIPLPAVLLVLDGYPLRRLRDRASALRCGIQKLPYLALAAGFAILAVKTQHESGALAPDQNLVDRLMQPAYSLLFHLWKMLAPVDLSPLYLHESVESLASPRHLAAAVAVLAVTVGLWSLRRRATGLLVVWLSYGLLISPMIGAVRYSWHFAADRNTYLACIPWAVAAAGAMAILLSGSVVASRGARGTIAAGALLVCAVLGQRSFEQTRIWKDPPTFWEAVLERDEDCYVAYNNRGALLERAGELDAALRDFNRALELKPDYASAYFNRSAIARARGNVQGVIADCTKAIEYRPTDYRPYINRGAALQVLGRPERALSDFEEATRLYPASPDAWLNRGTIEQKLGRLARALRSFEKALEVAHPGWPHLDVTSRRRDRLAQRIAPGGSEQPE